jgi:hypothetical protein
VAGAVSHAFFHRFKLFSLTSSSRGTCRSSFTAVDHQLRRLSFELLPIPSGHLTVLRGGYRMTPAVMQYPG